MVIKSISYDAYVDMLSDNPNRQYRQLRNQSIVLESEAQEISIGERAIFSRAYTLFQVPRNNNSRVTLVEVTDFRRLKKLAQGL